MSNAYIGIDLGTSGCRVIAIDEQSNIIASDQQALFIPTTIPPKSEQDPDYQWQVVLQILTQVISQCRDYKVRSIAVDATSGSILLTDSLGQPLSPILMYNDARAIEQSKLIANIAPKESGAHGSSSGLAKLLYLQQHTVLPADTQLLHQADWINFKLGAPLGISDHNNALKTGYDPVEQCWPQWVDTLTNASLLPKVLAPGTVIGRLSESLCRSLKLSNIPKIVAGTTDSIAGLLATGAKNIGDAVTSLGSTLVVKLISDKPLFIPEQGIYSHRLGDKWLVGGASNTGGAVLKYYFDKHKLENLSEKITLDATPADYYPLLSAGERFPINAPKLQPRLSPRPKSDVEFLHGMLTGIAKIEQQAYDCLQQAGATPITSIRTVGGGAVNKTWQSIRQQYITVPFITPNYTEAAYGAALLAKGNI
ncbi:MAG: FGGY-family carbohydrate kinase [Methylophaga sp.]|nr:FGGY-family carbohydrate kinase [Methylophaga sp.]